MRLINNKRPTARLSGEKLNAMKGLVEGVLSGDHGKIGRLKEHFTTGDDAIFSFAYLTNLQVLELFAGEVRTWAEIADTKSYTSFEAPKRYTTDLQIEGFARPVEEPGKPGDVAPIVPEGSPYPTFTFSGELLVGGRLRKRGAKFELTWEKIVDDLENLVPQIPSLITETFLNAEEWEIYGTLREIATAARALKAGTNLDGTTSVANAPLSREALIQAVTQLKNRTIDGRRVRINGGLTLVVPIGASDAANFYINTIQLAGITDTPNEFVVGNWNPLSSITKVVESEYVEDGEWFLLPAKGSTPNPVLELMKLAGHEDIELRVENVTGQYIGGGAVSPFEGSFDTDGAAFRGRYPLKGASWAPDLVIWSDGSGS